MNTPHSSPLPPLIYTPPQPPAWLHRSFELSDIYADLALKPDYKKLRASLHQPLYTVKDSDISYRLLNHWSSEGLLEDHREAGSNDWRKLSLKDIFWIEVVKKLREFGLPLDNIKRTYYSLVKFEQATDQEKLQNTGQKCEHPHEITAAELLRLVHGDNKPDLDVALMLALADEPWAVFILVAADGTAGIALPECIDSTDYSSGYPHYLRLSVNQLLACITKCAQPKASVMRVPIEEIKDMPMQELQQWIDDNSLPDDMRYVLDALQNQHAQQVTVNLKNGKISEVKSTRREIDLTHIKQIVSDLAFGEVNVKVRHGQSVDVTVTTASKVTS